jgi:hypothetical protein
MNAKAKEYFPKSAGPRERAIYKSIKKLIAFVATRLINRKPEFFRAFLAVYMYLEDLYKVNNVFKLF